MGGDDRARTESRAVGVLAICRSWQAFSTPLFIFRTWFGDVPFSLDRSASGSQAQQCSATSPQQLSSFSVQREQEEGRRKTREMEDSVETTLPQRCAVCGQEINYHFFSDLGPVTSLPLPPPCLFSNLIFFNFQLPFCLDSTFYSLSWSLSPPHLRGCLFLMFDNSL